ncbi:hypothetical protein LCGC14_2401000 [marine sediment metagenome]|uniref:Uncharacterized protein n=1 Tax=marine sediment metagenome TaxID=412755 RepID=A0A0F9E7R3_9ZZZZ
MYFRTCSYLKERIKLINILKLNKIVEMGEKGILELITLQKKELNL